MTPKREGIACIGNPLVESYAFVTDEFLAENNVIRGTTLSYPPEFIQKLANEYKFTKEYFGGSAVNVAKGLGLMGYKVGLLGQYGDDKYGQIVIDGLKKWNIDDLSTVKPGGTTTRIMICITPDAQRSMFGIFGASHEKHAFPVDYSKLDGYEAILMEGYQVSNEPLKEVALEVFKRAKQNNQKIILTMADIFWREGYKQEIRETFDKVNITCGTKEEYFQMLDINNIEDLLSFLENSHLELAVITMGPEGAYAIQKNKKTFIPAPDVPKDKVIDTTGAGDYFAAGIIYGYFHKYPIEVCGKLASHFSGNVIAQLGSTIDEKVKDEVKSLLA